MRGRSETTHERERRKEVRNSNTSRSTLDPLLTYETNTKPLPLPDRVLGCRCVVAGAQKQETEPDVRPNARARQQAEQLH